MMHIISENSCSFVANLSAHPLGVKIRVNLCPRYPRLKLALQLSKVFDKSALFMQNKANDKVVHKYTSAYEQKNCGKEQHKRLYEIKPKTKPMSRRRTDDRWRRRFQNVERLAY